MKKKKRICIIIAGDARTELVALRASADLIVTSPPYADARSGHYDSIAPANYPDWFARFHEVLWNALKPDGSFVLNIKDKVLNGTRCHYVWKTVDKLVELGWHCIDDYIWCKPNPMPGYWPTRMRDGWECGSTAIAALSLGRDCLIIDNNRVYCDVAKQRISSEVRDIDFSIALMDRFHDAIEKSKTHTGDEQMILLLQETHAEYIVKRNG